jgi:hypothetical protein
VTEQLLDALGVAPLAPWNVAPLWVVELHLGRPRSPLAHPHSQRRRHSPTCALDAFKPYTGPSARPWQSLSGRSERHHPVDDPGTLVFVSVESAVSFVGGDSPKGKRASAVALVAAV